VARTRHATNRLRTVFPNVKNGRFQLGVQGGQVAQAVQPCAHPEAIQAHAWIASVANFALEMLTRLEGDPDGTDEVILGDRIRRHSHLITGADD